MDPVVYLSPSARALAGVSSVPARRRLGLRAACVTGPAGTTNVVAVRRWRWLGGAAGVCAARAVEGRPVRERRGAAYALSLAEQPRSLLSLCSLCSLCFLSLCLRFVLCCLLSLSLGAALRRQPQSRAVAAETWQSVRKAS
jgi:hypothetical protein